MIHPLFLTLVKQPGLFLEHASAYADLASTEMEHWSRHLKSRAVMTVLSVLLLVLGLALAGVAGLLLAVVPVEAMPMPWLLGLIPLAPLVVAMGLAWCVHRLKRPDAFGTLRQQAAQDLATLKILDQE